MNIAHSRRRFLKVSAGTAAALGCGDLGFLAQLPSVSAAEARLERNRVRLDPRIEPLVRLMEETSRERLLEEVADRVRRGTSYRDVLTSLLLAGVRNIQPRPVGFKFHAVLVVNSAHLASQASPDSERWLPIFWALDQFKSSQARNREEGDWVMGPVEESKVPAPEKARAAFVDAMDSWDVAAADAAVAGLARSAGANDLFELFSRYGARDFREIGHKAIYVANSWRTLHAIGWEHAEPVLRSLAYALQDRQGDDPRTDAAADRPWRNNRELVGTIRPDWLQGKPSSEATRELLQVIRDGSSTEASAKVVALLNRGVAVTSIWDAFFLGAGEMLMRAPGILPLHAVTSTNAFHYAWQQSAQDETRRLLLLQNAAFLPLFRRDSKDKTRVDELEPLPPKATAGNALDQIFENIHQDRATAARQVLAYAQGTPLAREFMDRARLLIFLKGRDAHDYKFSAAVLEDYDHVTPEWRGRYLATSIFNLKGTGDTDNTLVKRTRGALAG